MLAVILGVPGFLLWQARPGWWVVLLVVAIALFVIQWPLGVIIKSWRSSNWVLRIARDGLWINLRSYLNYEFSPARTVAFVPNDEIAHARELTVKRVERNNGRTMAWTDRFLELELAGVSTEELRCQLAAELGRHVSRSYLAGLVTSRSRHGHVPVTVPDSNVIRIAWRGRYDWVSPSLRRTLEELRPRVRIGESTCADFTDLHALTNDEVDRLTRQLVESGDKLGAIKLLTHRRGCSTTEARQLVEELTGAV
jgi:hypothetical protein